MNSPPSPVTPTNGPRKDATSLGSFAELVLNAAPVPHIYPTPSPQSSKASQNGRKPDTISQIARGQNPASKDVQIHSARREPVIIIPRVPSRSISNSQETPTPVLTPSVAPKQLVSAQQQLKASQEQVSTSQQLRPLSQQHRAPSQQPQVFSQHQQHASQEPPISSQSSQRLPVVVMSKTLTAAERAEFQVHMEDTIAVASSKNGHVKTDTDVPPMSSDQRQKAQGAISRLKTIISQIDEGEAALHSGQTSNNMFTQVETADRLVTVLQLAVQAQLEKAITSVAAVKEIAGWNVEDLRRIQRFCQVVIGAATETFLGIGEGWDVNDVQEWTTKMKLAEQALYASRTVLRIMTAGSEDKTLFSEDVLGFVMEFIRRIVDTCVVSVVELRSADGAFEIASSNSKAVLGPIIASTTKMCTLLGNLILKTDVDEAAITSAESLCRTLIFVENASAERDSALGIQTFEKLRRSAMDVLSKIFARHSDQRQSIFDEILTSLERLPVTRQSARQYRMPDAKPIQLVSALLMRLVQTSATINQSSVKRSADRDVAMEDSASEASESEEDSEEESDADSTAPRRRKKKPVKNRGGLVSDLETLVTPLYEAANRDASYIVNFLVTRALSSSKSSDEPYRNLLDIFVEDFLNVLGHTDWPAAETVLRQLMNRLAGISNEPKSSAPAKAMALELMGSMLTGILDLQLQTQEMVNRSAEDDSELMNKLKRTHEVIATDDLEEEDIVSLDGPYRAAAEFLRLRSEADANVLTALGFLLTQWGQNVAKPANSFREGSEPGFVAPASLKKSLVYMIQNAQDFDLQDGSPGITTEEGRLGAALVTLRSPFCRHFNGIFSVLLRSMSSDQASLRSKSLRSVDQVLDKDPSILDRATYVLNNIVRCLSDPSPQVRDSALGLLARCLTLRPKLDAQACDHVLARTADANAGVKKRAMKLAKDLYLRNESPVLRSRIADALIHRISDIEESIIDLARQTLEEIWIASLHAVSKPQNGTAQLQVQLKQQASVLIDTVDRSENIETVMQDLLGEIMSNKSKTMALNIAVCKALVLAMVDGVVDEEELPTKPDRAQTMRALSIFAQARPKLFTAAQLQPLLPYLKNLRKTDDLNVYRYTIIVVRCTLPHIANLPEQILRETQQALLESCQTVSSKELKEVAICLWTVTAMIGNVDKLVNFSRSSLFSLQRFLQADVNDTNNVRKISKLLSITAYSMAAFDLEQHVAAFKEKFPTYKGSSVVALAIDVICPITSPKYPLPLREVALASICQICQAWPKHYLRKDICNALELVFKARETSLELVLMEALKDFFGPAAEKKLDKSGNANSQGAEIGAERITKTYVATDSDNAATSLAQRFLPDVLRIALDSSGPLALFSAHVVASINRLGLVHPKESAACLVALETSTNPNIAKVAFEEHRDLFSKHESMYEKESIRSIQQAFIYQRDIVKSTTGSVGTPPVPKLHMFWEVLKAASAMTRKRFIRSVLQRLKLEPSKLDFSANVTKHVEFTRFCVENLAFFDYTKIEEIQELVVGLEKAFSSTGANIAHGIEALLADHNMADKPEAPPSSDTIRIGGLTGHDGIAGAEAPYGHSNHPPVNEAKLRESTICAQILTLIWDTRTYLRKLWQLDKANVGLRGRPSKDKTKEAVRAAIRIPNSTGLSERYLAKNSKVATALSSVDASIKLCKEFQTTISVDEEVKVAPDGDDADTSLDLSLEDNGYATPSEDGSVRSASAGAGTPGKRSRKRKSASATPAAGNTPKKRKGSRMGR